ncbi:co-chaperone HscB [Neptunicella sp.]|uniref:co-chaperone HscB n=1 Tax=Neptunicella sp. TaxID=2125986 RepID=UPI003F692652
MNHFELFNLPAQFDLDLTQLSVSYQKLQQLTHPDKFATASDQQRFLSVQKNAQLNDAYQILKSPLLRAEYLLELKGMDLKHETSTMQDGTFLMQQMEWREQLEDIQHSKDLDALEDMDDEISQQIAAHLQQLKKLLASNNGQDDLVAANEIRKLKFLYKLRSEIANLEEKLQD